MKISRSIDVFVVIIDGGSDGDCYTEVKEVFTSEHLAEQYIKQKESQIKRLKSYKYKIKGKRGPNNPSLARRWRVQDIDWTYSIEKRKIIWQLKNRKNQ